MIQTYWLSNLQIVLEDSVLEKGAIRVEDGMISEIVEGEISYESIDCRGLMAIPGIVDFHGDMLERDIEPRPGAFFPVELGIYELDKRLVATGITTAFAAISFSWDKGDLRRSENAMRIIRAVNAQRPSLLCDMRVHARFEVRNMETIDMLNELLRDNQLHLVSLMDHTPGQGQYTDVDHYVRFMKRWMGADTDLIDENAIEKIKAKILEEAEVPRDWHLVKDMTDLAVKNGIVVASHDDDTIEKVNKMAELGVTVSEFPVSFEAAEEARRLGMHVVMGAPNAYRGKSTSNNLSALEGVRNGLVDSLATDYYPAAPLQAAFKIADDGILPLPQAIQLVTANPADAVKFTDRGKIAVGKRADIALVTHEYHHPRVHATFRAGEAVYWDWFMARLTNGAKVLS